MTEAEVAEDSDDSSEMGGFDREYQEMKLMKRYFVILHEGQIQKQDKDLLYKLNQCKANLNRIYQKFQ